MADGDKKGQQDAGQGSHSFLLSLIFAYGLITTRPVI